MVWVIVPVLRNCLASTVPAVSHIAFMKVPMGVLRSAGPLSRDRGSALNKLVSMDITNCVILEKGSVSPSEAHRGGGKWGTKYVENE